MWFKEHLQTAEQTSNVLESKDRRRPGRNDQVSSHLIPLLRSSAMVDTSLPSLDEVDAPLLTDDLMPARGITIGMMLSLLLWAVIIGVARAFG